VPIRCGALKKTSFLNLRAPAASRRLLGGGEFEFVRGTANYLEQEHAIELALVCGVEFGRGELKPTRWS